MDIQHKSSESKGAFFIEVDGEVAAEMTYTWAGEGKIIIDHTEVKDVLRGKGAGKKLLLEIVAFARNKNIKILPLCPFAKSVFDKDPTLSDVLQNDGMKDVVKEYSNGEVTVVWQSGKCTHSANCVRNLSSVFQPKTQPWIKMENGTSEEIVATVAKCPSGALSIKA